MKKSFVLLLILSFVAGYGTNALVDRLRVEQNKTGGDVSKAKRYNRIRNDEQLNLLQDKLQNDDEYFNQTKEVSSFLLSRVNTLADLTKRSVNQCSGIEELTEQVAGLKSLNLKANNTELALEGIRNGLDRMAQGKEVPDYDQSFNNALAGFFRIENQMNFGKSFVEAAGKYLESNENAELAALVSDWTVYGYQNAKLNKSGVDMAYWNEKYKEMSNDATEGLNLDALSGLNDLNEVADGLILNSLGITDMLQVLHLDYGDYPPFPGPIPPNPVKRDTLIN